eukprot:GILK01006233.1.p1 GENE.GILK01006233.1~~GILK01006233.1.p1  ORF type:complete len:526 (-),score=55.22 GILK01006233.1:108-1685(-)
MNGDLHKSMLADENGSKLPASDASSPTSSGPATRAKSINTDGMFTIDETREEYHDLGEADQKLRKWIFAGMLFLTMLINYDCGAVPACLPEIAEEININYTNQAMLGSLVYGGLIISSLFAGPILQRFSPRDVVFISILLNAVFVVIFSLAKDLSLMFVSRTILGMTQAFYVIYAPVWVDEFAPPDNRTMWMSLLQAAVPIGMMFGYLCSGLIAQYAETYSWRLTFQMQAVAMVPILIGNLLIPRRLTDAQERRNNVSGARPRMDSVDIRQKQEVWRQFKTLLQCRLFVWMTLALCALYFVVTGIQYWITKYMITVLGADRLLVILSFAITCITAPSVGVFVGGALTDRFGGYKGDNLSTAVKICMCFALFAVVFSFPIGFAGTMVFVIILIWMLLFFGASIMPTATGIVISAVPADMRSFSSAISMMTYNLLGYFLAPVLSGAIMDAFPDEQTGLRWGFRIILFWSIFGFICMLPAYFESKRLDRATQSESAASVEMGIRGPRHIPPAELKYEVARRRAHSNSF